MSEKIINVFIDKGLVQKDEKELFICALEQIFAYILNLFSVIFIGLIFNMLFEAILFTLTYIPIRIYAGGYHAKTQLRCYIFSVIMMIVVLFILKLNVNIFLISILAITGSLVILMLAPVEDKNKPLDDIEIKVYRNRTIRNLIIILIILFIGLLFDKMTFSFCISISLICNAIMLFLGKIKNFMLLH